MSLSRFDYSCRTLSAALMLVFTLSTRAAAPTAPVLETEYAFTIKVVVGPATIIQQGPEGMRRFVPITAGSVDSKPLKARVLPGGADWQVMRPDGVIALEARYLIETDDGVVIAVRNQGFRHGPPEVMAKIARGERVPPDAYYFRTFGQFEAPVGSRYEWLNKSLFLATLERDPAEVSIHFFRVR